MDHTLANHVIEARLEEEDRVISTVSGPTLEYMCRHGVARESRLRSHRGDLSFEAALECDLFEAIRLAARLSSLERNILRASRRNERLRSEIVRREADRRRSVERAAWRVAFASVGHLGTRTPEERAIP